MNIEVTYININPDDPRFLFSGLIRINGWLSIKFLVYLKNKGPSPSLALRLGEAHVDNKGSFRNPVHCIVEHEEYKLLKHQVLSFCLEHAKETLGLDIPEKLGIEVQL